MRLWRSAAISRPLRAAQVQRLDIAAVHGAPASLVCRSVFAAALVWLSLLITAATDPTNIFMFIYIYIYIISYHIISHHFISATGNILCMYCMCCIFPRPPNSRALLPTFRTDCPDGSHFAQMGSHFAQTGSHFAQTGSHFAQMGSRFAQNTTVNPCSLLSRHTPLTGICTCTQHPQAHPPKPLFLAWT